MRAETHNEPPKTKKVLLISQLAAAVASKMRKFKHVALDGSREEQNEPISHH
jgi:hypothetical protein